MELKKLITEALTQPEMGWIDGVNKEIGLKPPPKEKVDKIVPIIHNVVAFVAEARVATSKPRVAKKKASGYHGAQYHVRGLVAQPSVFLRVKGSEIRMQTEFDAAPLRLDYAYDKVSSMRIYRTKPEAGIPSAFLHSNKSALDLSDLNYNDRCEGLALWLLDHCPRMKQLDAEVRAAWRAQVDILPQAVGTFIASSSDKQREEFQRKLAKEFESCKNILQDMNPSTVLEVFKFARDHAWALESLVKFCRRNATDAIWVDESDVAAAMDLARVSEVMGT